MEAVRMVFIRHAPKMFQFVETLKVRFWELAQFCGDMITQLDQLSSEGARVGFYSASQKLQVLQKAIFEDAEMVELFLAAVIVVVAYEMGIQRPQIYHNLVWLDDVVDKASLPQLRASVVSGFVEPNPGEISLVIMADKVGNWRSPDTFELSQHSATIIRIFSMYHHYWRDKYSNELKEQFLKLSRLKDSVALKHFRPMYNQLNGKAGQQKRLKQISYEESFAFFEHLMNGDHHLEQGFQAKLHKILEQADSDPNDMANGVVPVEQWADAAPAELDDAIFSDGEGNYSASPLPEEHSSLDPSSSGRIGSDQAHDDTGWGGMNQNAETARDNPTAAGEVSEMDYFDDLSEGELNDLVLAAQICETDHFQSRSLGRADLGIFQIVQNHSGLRILWVQYKSEVLKDDLKAQNDQALLLRHSPQIEMLHYDPKRINQQRESVKRSWNATLGLRSFPESGLSKDSARHLQRVAASLPELPLHVYISLRRTYRPFLLAEENQQPTHQNVTVSVLAAKAKSLLQQLQRGDESADEFAAPLTIPIPLLVWQEIVVVLRGANQIHPYCSNCAAALIFVPIEGDLGQVLLPLLLSLHAGPEAPTSINAIEAEFSVFLCCENWIKNTNNQDCGKNFAFATDTSLKLTPPYKLAPRLLPNLSLP
jgi:hypothetical protein